MKPILILAFLVSALSATEPVDYVNPMIGTSNNARWMLFPGATRPFGMVALSPDNLDRDGWYKGGFDYHVGSIAGFSHLHAWTMAGLLTMPSTGDLKIQPGPADAPGQGYRSRYRHETETASPGYYAVTLDDAKVRAELTATTRCGFERYTFPETGQAHILFDLKFPSEYGYRLVRAHLKRVSDTEIVGLARQVENYYSGPWQDYVLHFVIRFSKPFKSFGFWQNHQVIRNRDEVSSMLDTPTGVFVDYSTAAGEVIQVQTGLSFVSIDQARLNLQTEMGPFHWDFDAARADARRTWNRILSKIEIQGGSESDRTKFYSNMYRSYCSRQTMSDVNGKYVDMCEQVRQLKDPQAAVYGSDAFWNTFWNLNQLWALVTPDLASKWVNSMLEIYDRGGWLPKGPAGVEYSGIMVGEHEISLIVSAWQKGIRTFDAAKAYTAMRKMQTEPGRIHGCGGFAGNENLASYKELGYVPYEEGAVSNTLEYAYDDWCVAQMAKALGKDADYRMFLKRSQNYRNVFDASTGYVRPRHRDGTWLEPFDPYSPGKQRSNLSDNFPEWSYTDYVEGNAWQYTFFVPHDLAGLIGLLGEDRFNERLAAGFEHARADKFASEKEVNHGNQPNMQAAYLFNYSHRPWETQHWVREILDVYYGTTPDNGYQGDEDEGQMGSWFVMSALGLFEMNGGAATRPTYEIGSPLFDRAVIHLDGAYYRGREFVIECRNNSRANRYIQSATLNGKPLNQPWFYHSDLVGGGKLVLEMGPAPNKHWGSAPNAVPPSS